MNKKTVSILLLLIASIIWGSAFVAQKAGASIGTFTYTGIRNILGTITLLPVIYFSSRFKKNQKNKELKISRSQNSELELATYHNEVDMPSDGDTKSLLIGGTLCGITVALGSSLQQVGMSLDTDAGKAGFITTLYILIVPILGTIIGKKVRKIVWLAVLIGSLGFYLLTMAGKTESFSISAGDISILASAFVFSVQILLIDFYSTKCDGIKLSCLQLLVAGLICIVLMFIFEVPKLDEILDCWLPIAYAGIVSSGIAFTLQIVGQRYTEPTTASLILSLEAVFAVISGWLAFGEQLTFIEGLGCFVIFFAVILAQFPQKQKNI